MEIIPKITLKTIGAQPAPRTIKAKIDLCHIYGRADRVNEGQTVYGIFHKYKGIFKAVNLETGEIYQSGNLLLPEIADAILLQGMLDAGATLGKEKTAKDAETSGERVKGDPIEFALCIGAVPQESKDGTGRGYSLTAKPLFESQTADPLAGIESKLKASGVVKAIEQKKPEPAKDQGKKK